MKKMKSSLLVSACLVLLFSLSACQSSNQNQNDSQQATKQTKTKVTKDTKNDQDNQSKQQKELTSTTKETKPKSASSLQYVPLMTSQQGGWASTMQSNSIYHLSGHTWTKVTPPSLKKSSVTHSPVGLIPKTDKAAWVIGEQRVPKTQTTLFHTTDGGTSWVSHTFDQHFQTLDVLNDHEAWVIMGGMTMAHFPTTLYHTIDGGKTWKQVATNTTDKPSYPLNVPITGFMFQNGQNGWMTFDARINGKAILFHTTNGGQSWTKVSIPLPKGSHDQHIEVFPPQFFGQHGLLPVTIGKTHYVYTTQNGGKSWKMPQGTSQFAYIQYVDLTHGFTINNGTLFKTTDGGTTWEKVADHAQALQLNDSQVIFIQSTEHQHIVKITKDKGKTWTSFDVPPIIK